ncbi:MAG: hypothetical protein KA175_05790 [Flavobacteriales bacterium]|nr:hypothetical protein [Flavobacteriales bacterium]MBP6697109.1 hypothetical protein [Flavobacteriales bacterium]
MKAHEGKATTEEIAKVFYIYSEMAVEYFTPHRHGLEPEYLDHVVLRFVDPTEQWNPEIPAQLVEWPIYDVLEHHAERSLLELSDDELARRP